MRSAALILAFASIPVPAVATPYTPLAWQQVVDAHSNPVFVAQRKHTTWIRDRNRNFIDDEIEARFKRGDRLDVVVDLNRCLTPGEIEQLFAGRGNVAHVGQMITFVVLMQTRFDDLPSLAQRDEVAMIEWRAPDVPELDIAARAIQARSSTVYPGLSAEDRNLTGAGITIAVVDGGVDDGSANQVSLPAGKFVAGVDVTDPAGLRDGTANPADAYRAANTGLAPHGSLIAAIALGSRLPGRSCRTPTDDPQAQLACGGIAPDARLVDVKMCTATTGCLPEPALDWIGAHADDFKIRVVVYAYTRCGDDDGTGSLAQQANFLSARGLVFVAAYGNPPGGCGTAHQPGERLTKQPASGSFVIAVSGSETGNTINRNDDAIVSGSLTGPRRDWNQMAPNLLALKPDLTAPQGLTIPLTATTVWSGFPRSSPASAVAAGAVALLLQAFPGMTPDSVKQALLQAADNSHNTPYVTTPGPWGSWDSSLGWGLLNVGGAINNAMASAASPRFVNCNTPSTTGAGQLCTLRDGKAVWDNTTDIEATTMPKVGAMTTIRAHVRNDGNSAATFLVNFGVYIFGTGNNQFHHIGTKQVTLASQQEDWVTMDWTPAATNHQCIQVSIAYGLDADYTDNLTQRNFQVLPSQYTMRVENPLSVAAAMEVLARSSRAGWKCDVDARTFTLDPFKDCARDVQITFNPPPGTLPGQQADCDVAVYATPQNGGERRLVGGVTVRTLVPRPCRAWGQVVDRAGRAVAAAAITLERIATATPSSKAAAPTAPTVSVATNQDGVFEIPIAPDARYRFTVAKRGVGRGELVLRPGCGLELPRLILESRTLSAELVHYKRAPQ